MKTPAQWREIYPVAEEVVLAIQQDTLRHASMEARYWDDGYEDSAAIVSKLFDLADAHAEQISPHPAHPPTPAPAQPTTDPAARRLEGGPDDGDTI